jgi:23S rRNA (cytidine1920-2'-O)/16S rRNA (cytidine1409-2'-O)-methyltransferase
MVDRVRLDVLLVERGLVPNRSRAQAVLIAGLVHSDGERLDKPGTRVAIDIPLEVGEGRRWVGRGAHKMIGALDRFEIDVEGLDAIDVGSSTGGFTQVLLERGSPRVIALDVGKGQLDWGLRNDPRVTVMEGCNARHLDPSALPFSPQIAVFDVSFISLVRVIVPVTRTMTPAWQAIALVKPQFEVGRDRVGKRGIVKDPQLHLEVLRQMESHIHSQDWVLYSAAPSPIRGAQGNREFLMHFGPGPQRKHSPVRFTLEDVVNEADGESKP